MSNKKNSRERDEKLQRSKLFEIIFEELKKKKDSIHNESQQGERERIANLSNC